MNEDWGNYLSAYTNHCNLVLRPASSQFEVLTVLSPRSSQDFSGLFVVDRDFMFAFPQI